MSEYEIVKSLTSQESHPQIDKTYQIRIPDSNNGSYPNAQVAYNLSSLTQTTDFISFH